MLKAKKLQKNYGSMPVLADISFSIERGQKVALVGNNGTGKTTLLKIIAGLEQSDAGELEIHKDACIGYLPQDTSLSGNEKVSEYLRQIVGIDVLEQEIKTFSAQLENPAKVKMYDDARSKYERLHGYTFQHRMEAMLSGFGLSATSLDQSVSNLSSGQKSKVALA